MVKKFIKSKSGPNAIGPKYRTPDHFLGSLPPRMSKFSGGKANRPNLGFNPGQFKTQHKG